MLQADVTVSLATVVIPHTSTANAHMTATLAIQTT